MLKQGSDVILTFAGYGDATPLGDGQVEQPGCAGTWATSGGRRGRGRMSGEAVPGRKAPVPLADHTPTHPRPLPVWPSGRPNGPLALPRGTGWWARPRAAPSQNPGRLPQALAGAGHGAGSGTARKAKVQGSRVSASRKTCSTCFPRCRLRSGFPTDPVTDDRYYPAPTAEPHHAHVGTDLYPPPWCLPSIST
jgi:hypothetical protein